LFTRCLSIATQPSAAYNVVADQVLSGFVRPAGEQFGQPAGLGSGCGEQPADDLPAITVVSEVTDPPSLSSPGQTD